MATATLRAPSRIVPTAKRLALRESPGSVIGVYKAAHRELSAGNVTNAWAMFHEALGRALQAKWRDLSGKPNSPISNSGLLVKKLRCSSYLDRWSYGLLLHVVNSEKAKPTLKRCDLLASIVAIIVFDLPAEGGAA